MAATRRYLELVPADRCDWRPHPKSKTMRALAGHLMEIPGWVEPTLKLAEFRLTPEYKPPAFDDLAQLLAGYDAKVAEARAALEGYPDQDFFAMWGLFMGDRKVFEMPRIFVIRNFVFNHTIHHRAQLGVYLRLNDIALPPALEPTADDSAGF